MKIFKEFFYRIDLFKNKFFFTYTKDQNLLTTKTGTLFSIFIYILVTILFFTSDFYKKTNPIVISEQVSLNKREKILFNKINFEVAIGMFDTNGRNIPFQNEYINVGIYSHKSYVNQSSLNYSNSSQEFEYIWKSFHNCTSQDFPINKGVFEKSGIQYSYCLDNLDFEIDGFISDSYSSYMNFILFKCQNTSEKNNCKTSEEIDIFLREKVFGIYFLDYAIENNNYQNPIYAFPKQEYFLLDPNGFKTMSINVKKLYFYNDDSLILDSEGEFSEKFMIEKISIDSGGKTESSAIGRIQFLSSPYLQKTRRIYQKFSALLAYLGASVNLFILIGNIFLGIKRKFDNMKFIYGKVFFLKNEDVKILGKDSSFRNLNEKSKLEKYEMSCLNNVKLNESVHNRDSDHAKGPHLLAVTSNLKPFQVEDKEDNSVKIHEEKYKKTKMRIQFLDFIKLKLCQFFKKKLNSKQILIQQAESYYDNFIKVPFLVKKMYEIETIKEILFNNQQKKMFELITNPYIEFPSLETINDSCKILDDEQRKKEMDEILYHYKNFTASSEINDVDRKLFKLLSLNLVKT